MAVPTTVSVTVLYAYTTLQMVCYTSAIPATENVPVVQPPPTEVIHRNKLNSTNSQVDISLPGNETITQTLLLLLVKKMEADEKELKEEVLKLKEEKASLEENAQERMMAAILQLQEDMKQLKSQTNNIRSNAARNSATLEWPRDCYDLLHQGKNVSGVNIIYPRKCKNVDKGVRVWCDMEKGPDGEEGGWTVVLSRKPLEEQVDFNQEWKSYRIGFGDPETEYWIGNDALHKMTTSTTQLLRVEMMDWDGETRYAEYSAFQVGDRDSQYILHLGSYSGTAGDAFRHHDGMLFSTPDRDNDKANGDCASAQKSGFWFKACHNVSPTNQLLNKQRSQNGITWNTFHPDKLTLKKMTFKLKPASCIRED